MSESEFRIIRASEDARVRELSAQISRMTWPEFMMHDPISNKYWARLYESFPSYQFALFDEDTDYALAVGHAVPIHFDDSMENLPDEGWDWAIEKAFIDDENGVQPNLLCALMIAVHPDHRAQGLSPQMVQTMRSMAEESGLQNLIAPVRPSLKSRYVLTPIDKYIIWRTNDGDLFDPWLRTHEKLGAKLIRICYNSMDITGTVDEWENWTEILLPMSGWYIISGALCPILIDREADIGTYTEPNVWMVHDLT